MKALPETSPLPPSLPPERRWLADRRARPTPFVGVFRIRGQRRDCRRQGEGRSRYFDCVSVRTAILVLAVLILCSLDALFTLLHIQNGGQEVNPIMRLVLLGGPQFFVTIKIGTTALGVIFLAIHEHFRASCMALHCVILVYGALLAYHAFLFYA